MTVNGKTIDTRFEDVKEYYLAESRFKYTLEHTDSHHEKDHQINPTHTFDILNVEGEYKNVDLAVKATSLEAKGLSVETILTKGEAWLLGQHTVPLNSITDATLDEKPNARRIRLEVTQGQDLAFPIWSDRRGQQEAVDAIKQFVQSGARGLH